jgi:DHA1 family tetracycline resistance protein-like MFS transporter
MTKHASRLPLIVIYLIVILHRAGINLLPPVMPDMFGANDAGPTAGMAYGLFLSLYALMQFIFAPLLGGWSDRIGRRPLLLRHSVYK